MMIILLCIETLGSSHYDFHLKRKVDNPGRRIICYPDKRIMSASGKSVTAEELFFIMNDIPNRQEYLRLDYEGARYPEEYRVMAPNGQLLVKILSIRRIEVNKWSLCALP